MFKKIANILLFIFIGIQFINPTKNESTTVLATDFIRTEKPPQQLTNIIQTSCYDCHSNNTNYPWFDRITPINFWVNGHVKHAKGNLNFSEWDTYTTKKKIHLLDDFIEVLEDNRMPLSSYKLMHPKAKLSENNLKALTEWVTLVKIKLEVADLPM